MNATLDDPMIAPDLADKVIPRLIADTGFDRGAFNQLVRAFMGLSDADGGPTFETLPWVRGNSAGSYLKLKQPRGRRGAGDPAGRGARSPRRRPRRPDSGSGSGTTAPAVRPVRRPGEGAQRLGRAERGGQHVAVADRRGLRGGRHRQRPARARSTSTEIRYASSDLAKAQLLATFVPGASLVPDSSLSGTDVVLVLGKNF